MKYFSYPINGKQFRFGLFCQGHPEDRSQERGPKCSWDLIEETIRLGLPDVVRVATLNKDLVLVNEELGHSVVLKLRFQNNTFIMIVKTVINEGKTSGCLKRTPRDQSLLELMPSNPNNDILRWFAVTIAIFFW